MKKTGRRDEKKTEHREWRGCQALEKVGLGEKTKRKRGERERDVEREHDESEEREREGERGREREREVVRVGWTRNSPGS